MWWAFILNLRWLVINEYKRHWSFLIRTEKISRDIYSNIKLHFCTFLYYILGNHIVIYYGIFKCADISCMIDIMPAYSWVALPNCNLQTQEQFVQPLPNKTHRQQEDSFNTTHWRATTTSKDGTHEADSPQVRGRTPGTREAAGDDGGAQVCTYACAKHCAAQVCSAVAHDASDHEEASRTYVFLNVWFFLTSALITDANAKRAALCSARSSTCNERRLCWCAGYLSSVWYARSLWISTRKPDSNGWR